MKSKSNKLKKFVSKSLKMDEVALQCPLCCSESFSSPQTLKEHLLGIFRSIEKCPICDENIGGLENLTKHLKDCHEEDNAKTEPISDHNSGDEEIEHDDIPEDYRTEEVKEDTAYYCEICDVHFDEEGMKAHLMKYHMGEQVVVMESQQEVEMVEELETQSQEENVPDESSKNTEETKQDISIKSKISDEEGAFRTKKLVEKVTDSDNGRTMPIMEEIFFGHIPNENTAEKTLKVYRCQKCDIRFVSYNGYNKHNCGSIKGLVCDICSVYSPSKPALTLHKRKYHAEELLGDTITLACEQCDITFTSLKNYTKHKRLHKPEKQNTPIDPPVTYNSEGEQVLEITETFKCEICSKEYNRQYEEAHMKSHNEELIICSMCNKGFYDEHEFKLHLQAHTKEVEKKLTCRYCKKVYSNKESLEHHVQTDCKDRKHSCSFCGRRFTKAHEKVKHERIHTGDKPHKCEICGKGFRVTYCLTLHMRTHSGIRPYECQTCGKRFKSHGVYVHHMQIHSDIRSYKCPYCPKAFKTAVQLAGHRNSHTKPFSCNICNRSFASLYSVKMHMKRHDKKSEFDFKCHICGMEYFRKMALEHHLLTHPEFESGEVKNSKSNKIKPRKVKEG